MIETKWASTLNVLKVLSVHMASLACVILRTVELVWTGAILAIWCSFHLEDIGLVPEGQSKGKYICISFSFFLLSSLLSHVQLALTPLFELLSLVFGMAVQLCAHGCAFQGCRKQRKPSSKPSKQYNGMKLLIKCKNKAAWHFPLFRKRFLNYQVHHLAFLYLTLSLSEPMQFVFHCRINCPPVRTQQP